MNYFTNLKDLIKYYKSKPVTENTDIDVKTIRYLEQLKSIYMIFNPEEISINDKIFEIEKYISKLNVIDAESKDLITSIQSKLGLLLINHISSELNIEGENI